MQNGILKDQRGAVLLLAALLILVLLGICAFAIDLGHVYIVKQRLQNAVDAACLAAAQDLPNATAAGTVAGNYMQLNGYNASDISITYSDSNYKISIAGIKNVRYSFANIFGFISTNVHAYATAEKGHLGGAFDYALFSGSTTDTLTLNGSSFYVGGNAHTNESFVANCARITITGNCEAVNTITVHGSQEDIDNKVSDADFVDMPDLSEIIRLQAEKAGQIYTGNLTFSASTIDIDEPIYVKGNVTINGSSFTGKGCILATGDITFNGSSLNASTDDAVCFYSKNGNITINGSLTEVDGILYAPNGSITINGSRQVINGRVIGKTVRINTSSFDVQSGEDDLSSLGSCPVKLTQ